MTPGDGQSDSFGERLSAPPNTWGAARLVSRLLPRARRAAREAALREGRMRVVRAEDVLAPDRIPQLARQSAELLLGAAAGYAALDLAARMAARTPPLLGTPASVGRLAALVGANLAAYLAMVPAHEALHALAILGLGGRPRFGLRLPWAAYCTAPDQVFTRDGYLMVAFAPLVVLSLAGAAVTWLLPNLGAFLWLGFVGNVAGAAGDLSVVRQVRLLPPETLIADTETGYIAFSVAD